MVQRIVDSDNPLTARVMVNRLWNHLIGKPLVDSPSDFGFRTAPPAVPEVLDDLAVDFARHWSVKKTVRRIVLSRIYRQQSIADADSLERDPDNRLLARANRRRRDFESLRDATLAVAGSLDRSLGGEPVEITLETPSPRRTIYAMIDRQNLPALFRTFDFASPDAHSPGRYFTTVPQQALHLLNHQQMHELARRTAGVIRSQAESDTPQALTRAAFRGVLGREPRDDERQAIADFLRLPVTPPAPLIDPRSLWSYGTAKIDKQGTPTGFRPFAVFKESRWQTESEFPSRGPMGHAYVGKETGHTAGDTQTAVVRRFTAPISGRYALRGTMGHRNDEGDGINASIWVAGRRLFAGQQKSNNRPYGPLGGHLEKGQTIDLVATAGESSSFDTFFWNAQINLTGADERVITTDSIKHFSGPLDNVTVEPLDRLEQLAQTLLMSNEFAFVD